MTELAAHRPALQGRRRGGWRRLPHRGDASTGQRSRPMSCRPARSRTSRASSSELRERFRDARAACLRRTGRASRAGDPLAAAADRERPSENSRRLWRPRRAQGRTTAIGWSRPPTTRRTPSPSSIRPTSSIGSQGASSFTRGKSPHGPPRAAMSPTSGRRKWQRSAMNIGSLHRAAGVERAGHRPCTKRTPAGPWIDNGEPLITGKPLDTTGPRLRSGQAADERRGHRLPHLRRSDAAITICSGKTTRTASGRARWRCCSTGIRA